MPTRLVRRRTLLQRVQSWLDPVDFLLWISEEIASAENEQWQNEWATSIGIAFNLIFLWARANSASQPTDNASDIFGEEVRDRNAYVSWVASFVVHFLTLLAFSNAAYTFLRRRRYRLFEQNIDSTPSTPSVQRVRVDSLPASSSPLRLLAKMLATDTARSRAHPDNTRDVWELAVWDPKPVSLRIFCLLSPGHVLIYWMYLPASRTDPRPSVTVFLALMMTLILSGQLLLLCGNFFQQSKDTAIIHQQVMNEYDTKFVHPNTQPLMRDVATQYTAFQSQHPESDIPANLSSHHADQIHQSGDESIDTYDPHFIINRTFRTRPNPHYLRHLDPDSGMTNSRAQSQADSTPTITRHARSTHPQYHEYHQQHTHQRKLNSRAPLTPDRPSPTVRTNIQRNHGSSLMSGRAIARGGYADSGGGSMGIFTHANSPLKKATSTTTERKSKENVLGQYTDGKSIGSSPLKRHIRPAYLAEASHSSRRE